MINEKASLVQIPSGYKSGTLYSVVPNTSAGDFTVTGDPQGEATRVNKDGLIESVAANVPRLNYDPSNPQDPHLLLEPQRINIYTYSQDLNQGNSLTNTTIDADSIVSPDGSLTGNKLTQTSGALVRKTLTILSGTYAWSFFAKKGDLRYLNARSLFVLNGTTPANGNTIIDLDTNTIAYKGTNVTSASIQQYPNDWIKVEIVATDNATGSGDFVDFFFTDSDTSTQSTGVAGNGFIWGVQFEAGSYPTSYIPTTIAVTRSAESCNSAGNSTVFNDSEGVLYAEIAALADDGTGRNLGISDGTTSNRILILYSPNLNELRFYLAGSGGSITVNHTLTEVTEFIKVAVKYKAQDFGFYVNGVEVDTNTSNITFSGLDDLSFNNPYSGGTSNFYGNVKDVRVYNTALTDSELQTLTT